MKKIAIVLVPLAIFLVGCGDGAGKSSADHVDVESEVVVPLSGTDDVLVVEFLLDDGTRCVISDGHRSGGVDCDWSK